MEGDTSTNLLHLLVKERKFEATDPRDKVYAVLGILADIDGEAPFSVDYSFPVPKVFQKAALHILETSGNLDLLLHCGSFRNQITPTWVPDWSIPESVHQVLRLGHGASRGHSRHLAFDCDKNIIVVRGACLDIVSDIVPPLLAPTITVPLEDVDDFVLESPEFLEWFRAIANLAYRDGKDGQYPVAGLSITGALNLLFQVMPNLEEHSDPVTLCHLPFLEVLNGEKIGSEVYHALIGVHAVYKQIPSLCVYRTEKRCLGFGDEAVAPGDTVATLRGLNTLVILRPEGAGWQLLGPCFGVCIIPGEEMSQNLEIKDIRIV